MKLTGTEESSPITCPDLTLTRRLLEPVTEGEFILLPVEIGMLMI